MKNLWQRLDVSWRCAAGAFVMVRVLLLLFSALVVWVYPGTLDAQATFRQEIGLPEIKGAVPTLLWGVWLRGDTLWYIWYARDGLLPADDPRYRAFWPLYPWLMRTVAPLLGHNYLLAGLAISNVALIVALVLLYRLGEMECGAEAAGRAVWYMLLFPSAVFLFAAYSESLFLLVSLAAFLAARRGRWGWAGVWAGTAAVLRIPGAFLGPALGYEYLRQRMSAQGWGACRSGRWWGQMVLHAWPFLVMAVGIAFVPVYTMLFLHGDSLMTVFRFHMGTAVGGGRTVFPWQSLIEAARDLLSGEFFVIQPFDLAATVLFLGLTGAVFARLPAAYGVYMAITLLSLTSRSIPQHPLLGGARYVLTLFPAFWFLGLAGRKPWKHRLILYPSVLLFGFFAVEFMIGGFVG